MSANNVIYVRKHENKYEVWYQGCADNDDLGRKMKEFDKLEEAVKYAGKLAEELMVEYGVKFINV